MTIPKNKKLEEIKNIPNTFFAEKKPYFTRRIGDKNGVKFEIICYYEDILDREEFIVDQISYGLGYENVFVLITEYDTKNFDISMYDGYNIFNKEYKNGIGESLYFKNINEMIDLFRNPESYVKHKIKEYLDKYKGEIPEVLREKVEKTLEKI